MIKTPANLKALINGYSVVEDETGMSPAKVYKLVNDENTLFLKFSDRRFRGTTYDVNREKAVLSWLKNQLPVPEVIKFDSDEDYDFY